MPKRRPIHKPKVLDKTKTNWLYDHMVRSTDPKLALAAKIRSSQKWKCLRSWVLNRKPLCVDPLSIHEVTSIKVADHVHHVKGISSYPELAFKIHNLAPLCVTCHNRIEQKVRQGKEPETWVLFRGKTLSEDDLTL